MPEALDAEGLEAAKNSGETWVIDFWAEWCGPCKQMEPIVDELAEELDDVSIGKVDIEEHQDLASQHGVRSIPTFLIVRDGEEVSRKMGAMSKGDFEEWIAENS